MGPEPYLRGCPIRIGSCRCPRRLRARAEYKFVDAICRLRRLRLCPVASLHRRLRIKCRTGASREWRYIGIDCQKRISSVGHSQSPPESKVDLPSQVESIVKGPDTGLQTAERRPPADIDYLSELIAIQQNGPKNIGFFGTRNMGFTHQQLVEILSYALVTAGNHIYTSGATGTNAAVIRGAMRAEKPELLTVVLPQSMSKQPVESQELLRQVKNVVEMPQNDSLSLFDASRACNMDIIDRVTQVICFAFHDSNLLLETCNEAKRMRKIVTLFYLD